MAQLEYEDVINTVLMRYGNRQGNTALAAQALIELELLMDEFFRWPTLPNFLIYGANVQVSAAVGAVSSAHDDILAALGYPFTRFVPQTHEIPTAVVVASGPSLTAEYTEMTPISADESQEFYALVNGVAEAVDVTVPKFSVRNANTPYSLDGGLTTRYATGQILTFALPNDPPCVLQLSGYIRSTAEWVQNAPNVLVAGLGVRMGTYIKDSEELARFQMEYMLAKKALLDYDIATEEGNKYGNRGVN